MGLPVVEPGYFVVALFQLSKAIEPRPPHPTTITNELRSLSNLSEMKNP